VSEFGFFHEIRVITFLLALASSSLPRRPCCYFGRNLGSLNVKVGRIALEHLPDMQELGLVAPPQPLLKLAYHLDLDSYILSFEENRENADKPL
ncbi:MAG TPA: hypothetical protein VEL31_20245, partial [Ktedonobacteraceae bacterium]|nr:hypothetical protein [Ktedonobacteraceae bacterium]